MTAASDDVRTAAACLRTGDLARALQLAEAAIAKHPSPEAFGIVASVWEARGAARRAMLAYRRGLARFPHHSVLTVNFARLLRGTPNGARAAAQMLSDLSARTPDFPPAQLSLIETLRGFVGDLDAALAEAQRYIARHPQDGEGHLALALTLWNRGSLLAACAAADESLKRGGKPARAWELKANIAVGLGSAPDALACYRALLDVAPEADTHSRLLMTMQYCDTVSEDDIFAETQAWVRRHVGDLVPTTAWPNIAFAPEKPLTFGALSRDFRQCSTLFLARPLFDNLPPEWTVVFYSNVEAPDTWTEFFRRSCESWVDVVGADDATVAQKIMADGVDVLLDLNGHTLGGRPGVFARKPAPVQIAWLDYVGTTGLSTMDAIIADAGHVPRTEQGRYVEPIVHVPDDLYRYAPPIDAPAVTPLPALQNGFVTFGCFNSAYKLSDMTLALWAEILRAMPTARLLLNASEYQYEDTRARFTQRFADLGVAAAQIVFQPGASDPLGMLRAYANVDLALDPMPYSGGLTTIEGLYMGVPVVTLPGSRFGSRHSAVHLRTVGLAAWIADDRAGYVRLALEHAADLQALAVLRAELRPRVMRSTLLDGPGFARDFCGAIRALWRSACRRAASV